MQSKSNYHRVALSKQSIDSYRLLTLLGDWRGHETRRPIYARLAVAVRTVILDGRCAAGVRLPAERSLAVALSVSRTTVTACYRLLQEEGFAVSRRGGGSWTAVPLEHFRAGLSWPHAGIEDSDWLDLSVAAPVSGDRFAHLFERLVRELGGSLRGNGYEPYGLASLRDAIAQWFVSRGLPTSPEEILVTSGAQQAIDLLVRELAPPLSSVLVEVPTYPGVIDVARHHRCRLVPVATGYPSDSGVAMARAISQTLPRLAYVIPDFHNPTGRLMGESARANLVHAAELVGSYLISDETFVELNLDEDELPCPLAGFGSKGAVITIGSMSKAFWGGLRIGWVRADRDLILRLKQQRERTDMGSPVIEQLFATQLLVEGGDLLQSHRNTIREQRNALIQALREQLPSWRFEVPTGGLSLWAELSRPVSTTLVRAAERLHLRIVSGPRFGIDGTMDSFVRIPFSLPIDDLRVAVDRLAQANADITNYTTMEAASQGLVV
ncbi:MAG: MocR-like transcription factor YczR [Ferrimicrobium sp.]